MIGDMADAVFIRENIKHVIETACSRQFLADTAFVIDCSYFNVLDLTDDTWWTEHNSRSGRLLIQPLPALFQSLSREFAGKKQNTVRMVLQYPCDTSSTQEVDKLMLLWEQIIDFVRRYPPEGFPLLGFQPVQSEDGTPLSYTGVRNNMFVVAADLIFNSIQK